MNRQDLCEVLSGREDLQKNLFIRGFLITDQSIENVNSFPFYGNWEFAYHGGFCFAHHVLADNCALYESDGKLFFLMGHAYNPFTMEYRERSLLEYLAAAYGTEEYLNRINELTGVFVLGSLVDGKLEFLTDPSGMQSACYGVIDGKFYLSSHAQLIGDLCGLQMDPLVKELVEYKWYRRVMGSYLPADLTPFAQVKRAVPNIRYWLKEKTVEHKRFWPTEDAIPADNARNYDDVIDQAAMILKNNMALIPKKWERPWISLTGGIDSNTTFAAANGCYEGYQSFSYVSAEKEIPDAEAAKRISERFHVPHHVYHIPDRNEDVADFEIIRDILRHNNGYVAERNDNETRKRAYLQNAAGCDVEVKSWTSETIRCYWYKHFGRKTMPGLSPKLYRNLYKIFIMNRRLAHKVDRVFKEYLDKYAYYQIPGSYPAADIHFNEVTWGSWGGTSISEMKHSFDLTVPYNNRRFLELMFRVPMEKRISDQHHLDLKKVLNRELFDMNIRVVNMKETRFRAFMLNIIFTINSWLPF